MPSTPIPINHSDTFNFGPTTPPHLHPHPGMTSTSPSSSISISPQTPFFPPPGMTHPSSGNTGLPSSPPGANSGFFKWAAAAASLGKSPPPPPDAHMQKGFDIPAHAHGNNSHHDEHEHENHDSFEFGDFDDLKSRSWNKSRRAVSMSAGPGASGITSMLSGFGALSPPPPAGPLGAGSPLKEPTLGQGGGTMPMSMPAGGVLAENAAKGQGVLRRLSMSGTSFGRPGFLSPTSAQVPSPPPNTATLPQANFSFPADSTKAEPPKADAGLQRAATVGGGTARGRRYSESGGKKRGVSPMGERILRDHGHF